MRRRLAEGGNKLSYSLEAHRKSYWDRLFERIVPLRRVVAIAVSGRPTTVARIIDDAWPAFVDTVVALHGGRAGWPAELDLARAWFEPHLERIHEDAETRRADLLQLQQIAGGYPSASAS